MEVQKLDRTTGKEYVGKIQAGDLADDLIIQLSGGLYEENLIGTIDNANKVFTTTYDYVANSTILFINGLKQRRGTDFSETGTNEITLDDAPLNTGMIDELEIMYRK